MFLFFLRKTLKTDDFYGILSSASETFVLGSRERNKTPTRCRPDTRPPDLVPNRERPTACMVARPRASPPRAHSDRMS